MSQLTPDKNAADESLTPAEVTVSDHEQSAAAVAAEQPAVEASGELPPATASDVAPDASTQPQPPVTTEGSEPAREASHRREPQGRYLAALAVGALGVVYGDIGTSPLYAVREAFHGAHAIGGVTRDNVYGILSLIFWSLALIISVKYLLYVLRADNKARVASSRS